MMLFELPCGQLLCKHEVQLFEATALCFWQTKERPHKSAEAELGLLARVLVYGSRLEAYSKPEETCPSTPVEFEG